MSVFVGGRLMVSRLRQSLARALWATAFFVSPDERWDKHLADDESFREAYVDRDLGRWQ